VAEIFGIITRQAIRHSTFRSVKELTGATGTSNDRCQPLLPGQKDADGLIPKITWSKN
jgi:hypothetical protein